MKWYCHSYVKTLGKPGDKAGDQAGIIARQRKTLRTLEVGWDPLLVEEGDSGPAQ